MPQTGRNVAVCVWHAKKVLLAFWLQLHKHNERDGAAYWWTDAADQL